MALRVWLPLNGTLENKGVSQLPAFSANNFVLNDNGKIGKCYTGKAEIHYSNDFLDNQWSLAAWVKAESWGQYNDIILCKNIDNSTGAQFYFSVVNGAQLNLGINGSSSTGTYNYTFTTGEWHHVAATYDGLNYCMYINGNLVKQGTCTSTKPSGTLNLGFGTRSSNAEGTGTYDTNGTKYWNDFRVYDHCLSPKEVKEISQGLVLHYKLDGWSGGANENLTPCGGTYTTASPWTTTKTAADGWAFITNSAFETKPSTTYTISVECDGTLSNRHAAGDIPIANKPWSFWAYVCNADTTKSWTTGGYDRAINLTSANNNYRKIGNRHVWTITLSSTEKYLSLRTNSYSDGSTSVTINWWNIKVEEGTEMTPWTLPSTIWEIDTTKITDSSGYGNDGIITGTLSTESDSDRYEISTHYPGSSYTDTGAGTFNWFDFSQCTLSAWIKPTASVSGWSGSIGVQHNQTAGHKGFSITDYANNFRVVTVNGSYTTIDSGKPLIVEEWHHCAAVLNGTNLKMYYDGAMVKESTISWGSAAIATDMRFATGVDFPGSDEMFTGNYSDVRMYCTALSDEDVLDLYHTSANVDNLGNLHAFEMVETHARELITGEHFARLGVTIYNTGTAKFDENGASYTGKVWAPNGYMASDYIEIKNTGYTYYYDITYSNSGGGMLDIGFERFDANKTSTSNSSCIYIVTSAAEINNMRITGTVNLAKDVSGNDVKYIRIRVLTDWNNSTTDNSRTANIKYFSLKEVPNNNAIAHHIYNNGVYESDTISDVVQSVSRQLNTGLSEFNDFIEK